MADGSEARVRQRFTGYEKDGETGLDFAEARMYQNKHGRFTAPDPLLASASAANPQTFNRYIYTGNNPVNITDPSGLNWCRNNETAVTSWTNGVPCGNGFTDLTGRDAVNRADSCYTQANGSSPCYARNSLVRLNSNGTTTLVSGRQLQDESEEIFSTIASELGTTMDQRPISQEVVTSDAATLSDHLVSAGGTIAENTGVQALLDFAGLNPPETEHTTAGRVIGHGLSLGIALGEIAVGASLIAAGTGGNLFGVGLDLTGVGAAVGVPVHAVSTAAIATGAAIGFHGVFTAGNTSVNIYRQSGLQENTRGSRPKKTSPIRDADGPHTTVKKDSSGGITGTETWKPNPRNPRGWDSDKRVDVNPKGAPHNLIPTPHTTRKGKTRPSRKWEIP